MTPHPTKVTESSALSTVRPPHLTYNLASTLTSLVSSLQLETVRRLCQSLETHRAFLLGDGTGVGKGRVLAGAVVELVARHGRENVRCLWCSASRNLHVDVTRDLRDVGAPTPKLFSTDMQADQNRTTDVAFVSYGTLAYDDGECLEQIALWLSVKPMCLVILDEAHLLRRHSKSARRVQALLQMCPMSVVYSTATLASHPSHLRFVAHLFGSNASLDTALPGGTGVLEALAIDMKQRGIAVSRQLDQSKCTVRIVEHQFSRHDIELHDECVMHLEECSAHGIIRHLFIRTLLAHLKLRTAIREARCALAAGRSVVITVQHTGEAMMCRDEHRVKEGRPPLHNSMHDALYRLECDVPTRLCGMHNAIDEIVLTLHEEFGVAEVTGRKSRLEYVNGEIARVPVPSIRKEINAFQAHEKRVAILSRAGSTGIGLHATGIIGRTHIFLELAWSAEDHLQQCGRTYRSGSTIPVDYVIISSKTLADTRVEGAVHERILNLGAVTHANRNTCSQYSRNFENTPIKERRTIAVRLMLAQCVRQYPGVLEHALLDFSPLDALARLGFPAGTPPTNAIFSILSEEATRDQVALCVACMRPMSTAWLLGGSFDWRASSGSLTPLLQSRVSAVSACASNRQSMLFLLPDTIVDCIVDYILADYFVDYNQTAALADALVVCLGSIRHLVMHPIAWTLNRALVMSLELQHTFHNLLCSHATPPSSNVTIKDLGDALSTATTRVTGVELVQQSERRTVVRVQVEPFSGQVSVACWQRVADSVRFVVYTEVDVRGTCNVTLLRAGQSKPYRMTRMTWESHTRTHSFVTCNDADADALLHRLDCAARRSAQRSTGNYLVVHSDFAHLWLHSDRTLVRIRAEGVDASRVGLLIGRTNAGGAHRAVGVRHADVVSAHMPAT